MQSMLKAQKQDLMKNFQTFSLVLTCALLFNVTFANNGDSYANKDKEHNSASKTTVKASVSIEDLGTNTDDSYAGSGFFFGDPNESLWGGSSNIAGMPDNSAALVSLFPARSSRYLFAKDFDINIPCNATITDITFNVTRRNNATVDAVDEEVRLFNPITLDLGASNLANPNPWMEGGSWETVAYSDATWGETITPGLLNNPRFGLVIKARNPEGAGVAQALVDAVELVICYEVTNPITDPISISVAKEDACFDSGSLVVSATGGSGSYEYSNDGGMTWQPSNTFSNLPHGDYVITVRNDDGSCQTADFFCTISADDRILQPGDAVVACAVYPGSRVTLAIEKIQAFNTFYDDGTVGTDVSDYIPLHPHEWTVEDLCGEVYSVAIDSERNLYTATTSLYDIVPNVNVASVVSCIDGSTGAVRKVQTLPGSQGCSGVEYHESCDQLFVANLDDGIIYRLDPVTGNILSSFDPLTPDDGVDGLAPSGERVIAVTYNTVEGRLYYSMWNSDFDMNGTKNTIRSISIDPNTCDFLPMTDQLEFELPWTNEYGDPTETDNFSMPVGDIEFNGAGTTMLLSEVGFDSNAERWIAHYARVMQYTGSTGTWALNTSVPAGNTDLLYEIGTVNGGLNARGGVDFANSGMLMDGCSDDQEEFIIATADALQGSDCNSFGCIYGFQYVPVNGGNSDGSVLLNIGRDLGDQQKSIFGDVDMVVGCPVFDCCPSVSSSEADMTVCLDATFGTVDVTSDASDIELVYHGSVPATPDDVYTGGTSLGTTTLVNGMGSISMAGLPSDMATTYYVYFIVEPTPMEADCRPYDSLIVTIRPNPTVTIDGDDAVCVADPSFTVTGTPTPAAMATGVFTTTAGAGLTDNNDGTASFDPSGAGSGTWEVKYIYTDDFGCIDSASYDVVVDPCLEYDLSLTKMVTSTGPYGPGSTVTYTITVQNEAGIDANNIMIQDVFPTGLNYITSDASTNANVTETSSGAFTITSIPSGNSETITLMFEIDNMFMGTSLTAVGQIVADDGDDRDSDPDSDENTDDLGDGIADDDEDSVTINIGQTYDLSLMKSITSTGPYGQGSTITYQLVLSNDGTLDASNVEVTENPPSELNYVSSDAGTNANVTESSPGVFVVASLDAGNTETINLTFMVDNSFMGTAIANNAQITADDGDDMDSDPDSDENTDDLGDGIADDDEASVSTAIGQFYDLSLSKTVASAGPFTQGSTITYQIVVSNDGTLDASSIEFIDTAPASLNYVGSDAGTNANVTESSPGVFVISSLSASSTETVNIMYTVDNAFMGTSISNDVEITIDDGDDADSDPDQGLQVDDLGDGIADDDEDTATITVSQNYDLSLIKNVTSAGPHVPGASVTFQLVLSNDGSIAANNTEITDAFPTGLIYVGSDAAGNANVTETSSGVFTVASLSPGNTETITLDFTIDPSYTGISISNLAQITADDGDDVDSDPDSDENTDDLDDGLVDDDESVSTIDVNQTYDLSLTKTVTSSGPYLPGSTITYAMTVSNDGTIPANNVEITDTPAGGLILQSDDSGANANVNSLGSGVYQIVNIMPGNTETVNLTFTIDPSYVGLSIGNAGEITADDGDDVDSDPDTGPGQDDFNDGIIDDDESEITVPVEVTTGSLGDFVWDDLNGNGVQDGGEPGLGGVKVELYDQHDFLVSHQFTDPNGGYLFEDVSPGIYYVSIEYPEDYISSLTNAGGNDNLDNDLDESNGPGTTTFITISSGEDNLSLDIGIVKCIPIGETVWLDYNQNDLIDPYENGINGMRVELYIYDSNDWVLWDVDYTSHKLGTPSDDGYFKFCVIPGMYYLKFLNPPATLVPVVPNFGTNELLDSDITGDYGPGTTSSFVVQSGDEKCDIGAGFYTMGTIGDLVWYDGNSNGTRENGEEGIGGVVVRALDFDGNELGRAITNEEGQYTIDYLGKTTVYLEFQSPVGYDFVPSNMGDDEEMDSDVDGSNGPNTTQLYNIYPGQHMPNVDAGLRFTTLAIEYNDFFGEYRNTHNYLQWSLESDAEVSHFIIERSMDGTDDFQELGKVLSKNSPTEAVYSFEDFNIQNNATYYYRIKQIELNGNSDYSKIISIAVEADGLSNFVKVFPNPASRDLGIEINVKDASKTGIVNIYDNLGQLVMKNALGQVELVDGLNRFSLDISDFEGGIYNVQFIIGNTTTFKKVIVLKE